MSGSGRRRDTQEVTGQPVARRPRTRVAASTASTSVGTPAASAKASSRVAIRSLDSSGWPLVPVTSEQLLRGLTQVGLEARPGDLLGADPVGDRVAQRVDALAGAGAGRQQRHPLEPVGVEQSADVVEHRLAPVVGHLVDVVEHDHHHRPVRGHRGEIAVVHRGVGVLLRVEYPDHQVGELDQAVDLEVVGHLGRVVVGQVEQDDALERLVLGLPRSSRESRMIW